MSFTPHEIALLKSSRLFAGLEESERFNDILNRPENRLQVPEDCCFLERGTRSPGLYILVHGSVEIFFCNAEGEEKVLHFIKSGETLAEETVSDQKAINYWARSLTPTVMLRIPPAEVLAWMDESWPFAQRFLELVSERICLLYADVVTFYSKTAVQRLACYLICGFETSRLTLKDSLSLAIPVPKKNLASRLSISQTHLSRALRDLTERGLITQEGNRLQVKDVEQLAGYVCPHGCDL
ncbi:Crp/Fnr family transcriptional regulator [Azospira sp. APE16]|uniref:Crp/Fnr family transcriptional regulator n=1 Tax=unclassified Azospira TaxID=2609269 RepID=UPI0011F93CFF|nr:Crp/Fnr family transcriptional regulator [Azospira sp. I09]MBP7488323.1 Crp/Fnr family transcriptional regulator [Azospira sp.]MDK9692162.1 Crp/Fnr family transcriptional regulator [Azospira sp.]TLS19981.1 MAG: Crp/Fnr family transcriptional regulator [Betaproteobacteria bacterium]BBN87766.1 CarD family transcriptional regulator [Azospira sp. I09]